MWNKLKLATVIVFWFGSVNAQNLKPALRPLKFLLGSWELKNQKGRLIETWSYTSPSELHGKSYRINLKGDTAILENVQIKLRDKNIFYIPIVTDQNEGKIVEFKLIASVGRKFVFENKMHDFPQLVIYVNKSKHELLAWIEGLHNGKAKKSEFHYTRLIE